MSEKSLTQYIRKASAAALAVLMLVSVLTLAVPGRHLRVFAEGSDISLTLDAEGTLTVSGTGAIPDGARIDGIDTNDIKAIVIEDGITRIGAEFFTNLNQLTSLTVADSVTAIGGFAFAGCTLLENIDLGEGLEIIGNSAFSGCGSMCGFADGNYSGVGMVLNIPDSVKTIGNNAFSRCAQVSTVNLGSGVEIIGGGAFAGCEDLTGIIIPDSVTAIGKNAFTNCKELTSAEIGSGATDCTFPIFSGCTKLTAITVDEANPSYKSENGVLYSKDGTVLYEYPAGKTGVYAIPEGATEIAANAFDGCSGLTGIALPETLEVIGADAFNGSSIKEVTIPDEVTIIGNNAFSGTPLETVNIGAGMTSRVMGDPEILANDNITFSSLFSGCRSLKAINVVSGNPAYSSRNGVLFNSDGTELILYPVAKEGTEYTVPDGVKAIGMHAFGSNEYYYGGSCVKLESIVLPEGLERIELAAFFGCAELEQLELPDSLNHLGWGALLNTAIDSDENKTDGVLYHDGWLIYAEESAVSGDFAVADGTIGIADGAFGGDSHSFWSAGEITIPASVKYIDNALCGLNMTGVTVAEGNENFAVIDDVLYETENGVPVKLIRCLPEKSGTYIIPDTVKEIGCRAFEGSEVDTVFIQDTIERIDDSDSADVNGFCYMGTEEQWNNVKIPYFADFLNYCWAAIGECAIGDLDDKDQDSVFVDDTVYYVIISSEYRNPAISPGKILSLTEPSGDDVVITLTLKQGETVITSATGTDPFNIKLPEGEYTIVAAREGYAPREYDLVVDGSSISMDPIELNRLGDVNGDGRLTTIDAAMANGHAKGIALLSGYPFSCADVNGDGEITTIDAAMINAHVQGVEPLWN